MWQCFFTIMLEHIKKTLHHHEKYLIYHRRYFNYWLVAGRFLLECHRLNSYTDRTGHYCLVIGYYPPGLNQQIQRFLTYTRSILSAGYSSLLWPFFCCVGKSKRKKKRLFYTAAEAIGVITAEQSRQACAQALNTLFLYRSQISAHSSHKPTQSKASS